MRIGIYGGTFNPFHNGHLTLARTFLSEYELDAVWLMVSPQNPFKRNDVLLSDELRYKMVSQALQNEPCLQASNYEFSLPKPSYTWHTLQKLS
ncbi:MAG: adenylyltransferase/cytidyltransferase family protein, partial [Prevotella sp.]|nr:adenylyltransferase/cytidyltransferase family protein [Prevotella sp.]